MENESRFDLENVDGWKNYLAENGYVVIKSVASREQVDHAIDSFWTYFETTFPNVKRNDTSTWDWTNDVRGISGDARLIHSKGAWYLRALPNVKQAFAKIWGSDDLIVSMDSLLLWKPWWINPKWFPKPEGLHRDQNLWLEPKLTCVQGMVPLYNVTEGSGGLQVVPFSHLPQAHDVYFERYPKHKNAGAFCPLEVDDPINSSGTAKLLTAEAGDLILWDSRTLHGGKVGTGKGEGCAQANEPACLPRMTMTVCMTERSRASDDMQKLRKKFFEEGVGTSHSPHEPRKTAFALSYTPIELTPEQKELV